MSCSTSHTSCSLFPALVFVQSREVFAVKNCPPEQFQLNIIYGHSFFYKPVFIGLGLCLLMTAIVLEWFTVLHVHCHISPSSLSPDMEASRNNRHIIPVSVDVSTVQAGMVERRTVVYLYNVYSCVVFVFF